MDTANVIVKRIGRARYYLTPTGYSNCAARALQFADHNAAIAALASAPDGEIVGIVLGRNLIRFAMTC